MTCPSCTVEELTDLVEDHYHCRRCGWEGSDEDLQLELELSQQIRRCQEEQSEIETQGGSSGGGGRPRKDGHNSSSYTVREEQPPPPLSRDRAHLVEQLERRVCVIGTRCTPEVRAMVQIVADAWGCKPARVVEEALRQLLLRQQPNYRLIAED